MKSWIDPRKEPVLYLGAVIILLQAVQAYLSKSMDLGTAVETAVTAVGTLVVRHTVTPSRNVPELSEPPLEGIEDVSQDPDFWEDEEMVDADS